MANKGGSGDDETFILPGNSGLRGTQQQTRFAGTQAGRTAGTVANGPIDPFETVLMPTARNNAAAPVTAPLAEVPAGGMVRHTEVIFPGALQKDQAQKVGINPAVGLLVVTAGPGKGSICPIYYGNNSIGRDSSQSVRLDFGDATISAQEQAFIRYDHEERKFLFIPNLSKTNVVAVNSDKPTMAVELRAWDEIKVGQTRLRFVPICGSHFDFDWSDVAEQ